MSKDSTGKETSLENGYEEKIKSLHTGAALIGRASSTNELYNAIIKTMTEILGYPRSGLGIPEDGRMHFKVSVDDFDGQDFSVSLDVPSITNRTFREKKTQIVNDVRGDPDYFERSEGTPSGEQVLSSLNVPVLVDKKVRAIIILESFELNTFSEMDVDIMEVLGMHISSAFTRIDQINEIFEGQTRVQAIMNQAADSIILMDIEDHIIFWNPAAERLFGFTRKESNGKTFSDLLVPDAYKDKYINNRNMMLGSGLESDLPTMKCVCQKKSGENVVVEVSHSFVQYDGVPHILRMIRDASEKNAHEKRLELIYEHASKLAQAKNIVEVFTITREATSSIFGANHGSVAIIEDDHLVYVRDDPSKTWWRAPLTGKGISVRAANTGETQYVPDVREDPDYTDNLEETYTFVPGAELDVPIKIDGKVVGVFNVESTTSDVFTDDAIKMVDIIVESIASSINRLRAEDERKKFEEQLESLHKSAIILNNAQTKKELFESTINIIKDVLGIFWIGIAEPSEDGLRINLSSEYSREEALFIPYDSKSVILRSYRNNKTVYLQDASLDPDYLSVEKNIQYASELVVPVFIDTKITALINIEAIKEEELGEQERELVEILALYMGSAIDRIQKTQELRESEARIRVLSQNAVDAIFVVNREREFVLCNPSMKRMFGLEEKDFQDTKLEQLIVPEDRWDAFYGDFENIIEKRVDIGRRVLESVAWKSDGTEIQVGYTATVIELDGEPHALFIMRDVTEQKEQRDKIVELNKELERSNKDLESYTYVVSHDLKAPLRSIRSFGGFIMEDNADQLDEEGKEYLDRIINAATHMDNLIGDLLILSRVGRKFTEVEEIALNEVIDSIEADIYASIKERNGQIIRDDLPAVVGQKTWVRQLFTNLITNGLKFNKSGNPTITIKVDDNESEYTFSVNDNGIGISKEYHEKIFQLFERLHTTAEFEGTGAGLAICNKIVENFGGKLWVESQAGTGSTFYFTYPKEEMWT